MTDIGKCKNKECPLSPTCYRFRAKANKSWQAYLVSTPTRAGLCEFYWPVTSKSEVKRLNQQIGD